MSDKIIEVSMQTGWDWAIQGMAILSMLINIGLIIGLGILVFKGIQALNIYIKKNK